MRALPLLQRRARSHLKVTRGKSSTAFTLIEVLVVISIIALLMLLAVAAAISSRGAARRARCANNLKQIGLGINTYSTNYECLPMAYGGGGNGISFLVAILPYIDQAALYNLIDMRLPPPQTVLVASLSSYLCPSDGLVRTNPLGGTNYAGNQGSGVQVHGYNGAFSLGKVVRYSEFSDGTSHTAAVSEWLRGYNTGAVRDPLRSVFLTAEAHQSSSEFGLFATLCSTLDTSTAPLSPLTVGAPWTHGDFGHSLYNHVMPPGNHTCLNGSAHQTGAWTAKSNHGEGVYVLMADGHVAWVKETITTSVWRALGSRNGGELVRDSEF